VAFNLEHCIEAVAASLEATAGVGMIHTRRRLVRTEQDAHAHFFHEEEGRINGWTITLAGSATSVTERHPGLRTTVPVANNGNLVTYQLEIEAYYGIDDAAASEVAFRAVCESVIGRMNAIGKLTNDMTAQLPTDIETFGYVTFAGMFMLHFARIRTGFQGRAVYAGS
jgi:hypothetical protein